MGGKNRTTTAEQVSRLLGHVFLLVVLLALAVRADTTISIGDPRIYLTEQNWYISPDESFALAANSGSYIKLAFTGSQISIVLDHSGTPNFPYATIGWTIDGRPEQIATLPLPSPTLSLAKNLPSNTNHTLEFYLINSLQSQDRWFGPACHINVTKVIIDEGATLLSAKDIPFFLSPKRLMVYWDSIGEGVEVMGGGGDLKGNNGRITWAFALSAALQAELSVVAWGAQGYTVGGAGNVPQLWDASGQSNVSAWNWFNSKYPRTFTGAKPCPDYILCGHGTNDGLRGSNPQLVFEHTLGWLESQRGVCKDSWIFLAIPFGRFEAASITKSYTTYTQKFSSDKKVVLIDLGTDAAYGLTHFVNGGSFVSVDGIHPLYWRDGQLGAMLARAISRYV